MPVNPEYISRKGFMCKLHALKICAIWYRMELNDRVSRFRGFHELSDIDSDEGQSWS